MKDYIDCTCCNGSGKTLVTGKYRFTLSLLRKHPDSTGAELAEIDGCYATAMNNRLAWLERNGLAIGTKDGTRKYYRAK